jgi:SAM-dependent methyltransferase
MVFVMARLGGGQVRGRKVVELGIGSSGIRSVLEAWGASEYCGVDITPGPGVDVVCSVERILDRLGPDTFDIVISTEMLEHVHDWRAAITSLKALCRPGGRVVLTTRSLGYPRHGPAFDYWRFEPEDMNAIFRDFENVAVERDPSWPGVFVSANKPEGSWTPLPLAPIPAYSMVSGTRMLGVPPPQRPFQYTGPKNLLITVYRLLRDTLDGHPPYVQFRPREPLTGEPRA